MASEASTPNAVAPVASIGVEAGVTTPLDLAMDAAALRPLNGKKLVPLAVAALLFDADLDRVRREGRRLLAPFVVAALGTIAGTVVAWRLVPLQRGIPALAARATMASALTARHIGGAVNYVSVAEYGGAAPELVAAGIAADNAVVAPYFVGLFAASGPAKGRIRPPLARRRTTSTHTRRQ